MSRCRSCASEIPAAGRYCPTCGEPQDGSSAPTRLRSAGSDAAGRLPSSSSDAMTQGRFVPGAMLSERYRIVGLLGRGGMGEVYRADDLRLGQAVALKLLPEAVASDPERLERFHTEVRLARQVSHPNVCRVYDIGEASGHYFLSMEYVDGEDLASLLRRIGRLPGDKAVEIARQLAAGLAAAHERGVLHRDLKPANIMIDGRGRVRITDFGLAGLAGGVDRDDVRAGTPTYMAPEQLAGHEVSVKSDLYSLGLVLYEVFTGRPAYKSETLAALRRERESSAPASPSSVLQGIDPAVERIILRCLAKDPRERPASALAVAAALPGGDPLAAALAAGETPSPEMVAAAGEEGGLPAPRAWALLGCTLLGLLACLALAPEVRINNWVPLDKPPDALADRAREIAARLNAEAKAVSAKWGFDVSTEYLDYIRSSDPSRQRWERLRSGRPPAISFWFRQSPRHMVSHATFAIVSPNDPPFDVPGMTRLQLDTDGRLIGYESIPPERDLPAGPIPDPDWKILFDLAGLDLHRFDVVEPAWIPRVYSDRRAAWEGVDPQHPSDRYRIEAAAYRGRPVSFVILGPWKLRGEARVAPRGSTGPLGGALGVPLLISAIAGGAVLARQHLRLGKGDRAGAFKVAIYFVAAHVLVWGLLVDHVPDLQEEWGIFTQDTGWTLFNAALVWIFYLAIEPLVRRRWPETMISWSRVLAGRFRDPLVGRDLLIGCAVCSAVMVVLQVAHLVPAWIGLAPAQPEIVDVGHLSGFHWTIGIIVDRHVHAILEMMEALVVLLMLRIILRNPWLAGAGVVAVLTLVATANATDRLVEVPATIAAVSMLIYVLIRFGLLASMAGYFGATLLVQVPLSTDMSAWYAGRGIMVLAVLAGLSILAFKIALAGRPAFKALGEEALQG